MIKSWKELPIGKYQEICKILDKGDMNDSNRKIEIASVLSGMKVEEIERLPLIESMVMFGQTDFLFEDIPSQELCLGKGNTMKIGEQVYAVSADVSKIITRQFVDYQATAKILEQDLVPFMSTMLVPVGKGYGEGYNIGDVQDNIRENLTMVDAVSLKDFFLRSWEGSIRCSLSSLESLSKKKMTEKMRFQILALKKALMKFSMLNGDGSQK